MFYLKLNLLKFSINFRNKMFLIFLFPPNLFKILSQIALILTCNVPSVKYNLTGFLRYLFTVNNKNNLFFCVLEPSLDYSLPPIKLYWVFVCDAPDEPHMFLERPLHSLQCFFRRVFSPHSKFILDFVTSPVSPGSSRYDFRVRCVPGSFRRASQALNLFYIPRFDNFLKSFSNGIKNGITNGFFLSNRLVPVTIEFR